MSKQLIKRYQDGLYDYDAITVEIEGVEYQIPIKKGIIKPSTKEININYLDRPIEEISKTPIDK